MRFDIPKFRRHALSLAIVAFAAISALPCAAAQSYLADNVRMSVSGAPGTGSITLGSAVAGAQSASTAGVPNGAQVSYFITDGGSNWEIGHGTYSTTGPTLTRGALWSSAGANTAISLDSSAIVELTVLAEDFSNYASLAGNNAFSGTNTVATQSARDNSTKVASTAYADAASHLGSPTTSGYSLGTVYQAATDGFVAIYIFQSGAYGDIQGKTDGVNPPSTVWCSIGANNVGADNWGFSCMFPVKKGNYWEFSLVTGSNPSTTQILWMPIGN